MKVIDLTRWLGQLEPDSEVLLRIDAGLTCDIMTYNVKSVTVGSGSVYLEASIDRAATEVTSDPNSVVIGGGDTTRFRALVEILRQVRNKYNVKVAALVIEHVGLVDNLNKIDPQNQQAVIDVCRKLLAGRTPAGQNEPDESELKTANENRQAMMALIDEHKNALLDPVKMLHWTWLRVTLAKMDDADWLKASLAAVEIMGR